jgi:uncharacterized protein (TIGR03546 family)
MLPPVVPMLRMIVRRLMAYNSPHQLAAGFTLGMIFGLMPKGNLIVLTVGGLVFALRVNRGLALAAAMAFTVLGPYADGFSHKLGMAVLSVEAFQPIYASLLCLPLGPWIGFQNTVVTGSLLVGLYVAYPVYWFVRVICTWIQWSRTSGIGRTAVQQTLPYPHKERLAAEGTA